MINIQEYDGNYQNNENNYMEQEEEWEREGLLDPAWEKQQRKVGAVFNSSDSFNSDSGLTSNRPSAETLSPAIFISLLLKSFVILSKGCIY